MRIALLLAALAAAPTAPAAASNGGAVMGEVWVWPEMFRQALGPLAPLSAAVARDNLCPGLRPADDGLIHRFDYEARFRRRGTENIRYSVSEIRLNNPTGCAALDEAVTTRMRAAVPEFAEPRRDQDGNGWWRLPGIELRVSE